MRPGAGQLTDLLLTGAGTDDDLEREFEARLAESSRLAFRVAFSVLRHREDAEDVAQEACAKAHRRFSQLRHRDRFRAWLVRMTWRMALDRQRGDRRRARLEHEDWESREREAPPPPPPSDALEASERAERLWKAIDALPEKLRLAIVLVNIEEHDLADVAKLLGVATGTVKWRLFVARKKLKDLVQ